MIPELVPEAATELAATSRAATYANGETIVPSSAALGPGVVVDGTISLSVVSADGREATLRIVGSGSMFGLVTLFEPRRSVIAVERTVVAMGRPTVILFDRQALHRLASRHASLAMRIASNLADSASVLSDSAGQLAFQTVRQRVASHLLQIARPDPTGRRLAVATQQDIARSIGTVREVVARTIRDMREAGVIAVSPGRIEVLDEGALSDTASGVT